MAGRSYEDSARWFADIVDNCAGKCGWLEASLLKTGADGLGNVAYGALGAGSTSKPGQNVKPSSDIVEQGGASFSVADRVYGQLIDPRMGQLAGKLSVADLEKLANSPNATRVLDIRSGHINVIQELDGKLLRITIPRDEMKIISVGPIRQNQVNNLIKKGDFVPLR